MGHIGLHRDAGIPLREYIYGTFQDGVGGGGGGRNIGRVVAGWALNPQPYKPQTP